MRYTFVAAALSAAAILAAPAQADVLFVPTGNDAKAVPQLPPGTEDTAEEIAKDAARDLKDSRFYNKPGATRANYDQDWQTCRLIARGSQTPTGTIPYYYNPAVVSPLAAGIGAGIGGAIANAIIVGQQRRANRRNCLLIKGWRLVELDDAETARISKLSDAERDAHFNTVVGADRVEGKLTERVSFSHPVDPALKLDAPAAGEASLFMGKKVDTAAPFKLEPGEAAVVIAYRRPDEYSAGRGAAVQITRYDMALRDLVYQPRDWKKKGDKTTYSLLSLAADKKAPLEVQVLRITPGDYVLSEVAASRLTGQRNFCFGAPAFSVAPGEVVYLGDFIPFTGVPLASGEKFTDLVRASHLEDARKALAGKQPELAAGLSEARFRNKATYACAGISMERWDLPGVESLPEPEPVVTAAAN